MRVKLKIESKEEGEWLQKMAEGLQVLIDRIKRDRQYAADLEEKKG